MISMKRIAQEAGVSRATVSYVLNGKFGAGLKISEPVIRKVQTTAQRLGYVRNELVNSVVTGKSRVIALISSFHDYMTPAIKGFVEEAARHHCLIKLIPLGADINQAIMQAVEFRVAGIYCTFLKKETIEKVDPKFFTLGIPSIGLSRNSEEGVFDQKASSRNGTEYLLGKGFSDILFFGSSDDNSVAADRRTGYAEAMRERHLHPRFLECELFPEKIRETCEQIIDLHPAAVQCANDHLALDLLNACYHRKLFVPAYFSVLGFGNVPGSSFSAPHLTTVNEPYYETGEIMFRQIYRLIFGGREIDPCKLVGEVIERESVRIPNPPGIRKRTSASNRKNNFNRKDRQ